MSFELVAGFLIVTLGLAGMLVAWLHPSPGKSGIVKALAWPEKEVDRANVALASLTVLAIGMFFFAELLGGGWTWHLIWAVVLAAACLGRGLRQAAV